MAKAVIYTDFDGVINAFVQDKILRRGGQGNLGWLKPEEPRRILYDTSNAFLLNKTKRLMLPGFHGKLRIRWSEELTGLMYRAAVEGRAELNWLSTWQPFTAYLNEEFGWDSAVVGTVRWYDPETNEGRLTGKRNTVRRRVEVERQVAGSQPIVWIDDEECCEQSRVELELLLPAAPVLMVRPDERIGISRRQWALIEGFIADPADFPAVTLDEEPTIHEHQRHIGY